MKKQQFSAERLETNTFNYTTIEHLHRYTIAKEFCTGKQVLDIACGEGYGCNLLSHTAEKVTGVDIDGNTVARAKRIYKSPNIDFKIGTCSSIPLEDSSIDVVVSFETIEHHNQHEEMLAEIKRVLKTDGVLIISTPDKKHYSEDRNYTNSYHVKELYLEEFEELIKKHFDFYQLYYQKYISGSLIVHNKYREGYNEFYGTYETIEKNSNLYGIYNLCIAGNNEINKFNTSVFTGEVAVEQAAQEIVTRIQSSNSYKLGHFLLSPFRFLKKWHP